MIYQLRTYTVNRGMMDAWVELFNDKLVPIQNQYGIGIDGMWVNEDQNQFIWIRSFNDAEDVKAKEAAFYASPEWNGNNGPRPHPLGSHPSGHHELGHEGAGWRLAPS